LSKSNSKLVETEPKSTDHAVLFLLSRAQLESALLAVLMAVIAVAWLVPWVTWAERNAAPDQTPAGPLPLGMVGLVLIGALITRWMLNHSTSWRRMALVISLGGLALIVLVEWVVFKADGPFGFVRGLVTWNGFFSPEFIVLFVTAVLWLRGALIGRSDVLREDIESMFYTGILALIVLLLINNAEPWVPLADIVGPALIFFAASLLALALVGPEHAHFWQRETSSVRLLVNRYWLVTVAAIIALIVVGGFVLASSTGADELTAIRNVVRTVVLLLAFGVQLVMSIVVQIIVLLLMPLLPLLEKIAPFVGDLFDKIRPPESLTGSDAAAQAAEAVLRSPDVAAFSRGLVVIVILMLFGIVMWIALLRFGFLPNRNVNETHENIASRELLMKQLRDWFNRRRGQAAEAAAPYLTLTDDDARSQIRRAYQHFLGWASSIDRARAPHQTPAMFSAALSADQPDQREAIVALTVVYERARYSIEPLTSAETRIAQDSLVTLQAASVIKSSTTDR
jgi:hypothetical protein